jgi:hypothetical protein
MTNIYYYLFLLLFTYKHNRISGEVYQKQNNAILIVNDKLNSRCWINIDSTQVNSIQLCQRMNWIRKNGKWQIGF